MIINQQPPSSGGGGGAGEWTDIRSAVGSDDTRPSVFVCETDGTYVHVMGWINGVNETMYIEGYPPKEDITANMYDVLKSPSSAPTGTVTIVQYDGSHGVVADFYHTGVGTFSVVYPIAN